MTQKQLPLNDRAIEGKKDDLLDRAPFVESLIRSLIEERIDAKGKLIGHRATQHVVGLTGAWGLGKSSIIAMTAERLGELKNVVPVVFNPWLFSGRDELVGGFFGELRHALGASLGERGSELRDQLDKYWGALAVLGESGAAVADASGTGGVATLGAKVFRFLRPGRAKPKSAAGERKSLEKKLKCANAAVVVLIDELDRVEDSEVRAVAQLVKAIGEIKGISYLVAYEPRRVAEALGRGEGQQRIESGERYLEKIIQHPIPIRPLFADDVEALLTSALASHSEGLPEADEQQNRLFLELKAQINTPREIKRLIGTFAIIQRAVSGEICPYDVLAYSWIITRSPSLQAQITAKLDELVDDPTEKEMSDRVVAQMSRKEAPSVSEILGEGAVVYESLFKLLFPRFGSQRDSEQQRGLRISRRQNLVRILYLGNPPTLVSRKMVYDIWSNSDAGEVLTALSGLKNEGRINAFLDRLGDFLYQLGESGDPIFWGAVAKLIERKHDWICGPNIDRAIAQDAAETILRLGLRSTVDRDRVKKIFNYLVEQGDLSLTPYILRKHLFRYGLTKHGSANRGDLFVFSEEETRNWATTEIERYKDAVLSGKALRRLPNVEAIYAISNLSQWGESLRQSFTQQLDTKEAIATWAALLVPPGYTTDKTNLDEIIDTEVIKDRMSDLGKPSGWVDDPWVKSSTSRLFHILDGRDPLSPGDDY